MIVLHVFGKICNMKGKFTEIIAYNLAIFLKVVHEEYHRSASCTSFSVGSGLFSLPECFIWTLVIIVLCNFCENRM